MFPLLVLASCGGPDRLEGADVSSTTLGPVGSTSGGPGSGSASTTGSQGTGTGAWTGSTGGGTSGIKFDVEPGGDLNGAGDGGMDAGCRKIDFLFVIDNSISMGGSQASLIASFPGFIAAIQDTVEADDYQILVTDSDWNGGPNYGDTTVCDGLCAGESQGSCNNEPCGAVTCDGTLGAGVLRDKHAVDCGVTSGARYMLADQPDLAGTFACIAEVGTDGSSSEMTMQAAISAVTDRVGPGECNEGFLREDAILVVTLISDEPHSHDYPMGGPATWAQVFVDAKGGDEDAVVALAVVDDQDEPGGLCPGGGVFPGAPLYRAWAEEFVHGRWGSVCAPDYSPFFLEAVSVIDTACDDFEPPG